MTYVLNVTITIPSQLRLSYFYDHFVNQPCLQFKQCLEVETVAGSRISSRPLPQFVTIQIDEFQSAMKSKNVLCQSSVLKSGPL